MSKFRFYDASRHAIVYPEYEYGPYVMDGRVFIGLYDYGGTFSSNFYLHDTTDKYVIMQSTGFRDKNGIEIYEGDILATKGANQSPYDDGSNNRRIVKRLERDNQLHLVHSVDDEFAASGVGLSSTTRNRFEVVGNIYDTNRT